MLNELAVDFNAYTICASGWPRRALGVVIGDDFSLLCHLIWDLSLQAKSPKNFHVHRSNVGEFVD
jgi:hypothetical protein